MKEVMHVLQEFSLEKLHEIWTRPDSNNKQYSTLCRYCKYLCLKNCFLETTQIRFHSKITILSLTRNNTAFHFDDCTTTMCNQHCKYVRKFDAPATKFLTQIYITDSVYYRLLVRQNDGSVIMVWKSQLILIEIEIVKWMIKLNGSHQCGVIFSSIFLDVWAWA